MQLSLQVLPSFLVAARTKYNHRNTYFLSIDNQRDCATTRLQRFLKLLSAGFKYASGERDR